MAADAEPAPMSAAEFGRLMDDFGLTDNDLSHIVGIRKRSVQRWRDGVNVIPPAMAAWLRGFFAWLDNHPVPESEWTERGAGAGGGTGI